MPCFEGHGQALGAQPRGAVCSIVTEGDVSHVAQAGRLAMQNPYCGVNPPADGGMVNIEYGIAAKSSHIRTTMYINILSISHEAWQQHGTPGSSKVQVQPMVCTLPERFVT